MTNVNMNVILVAFAIAVAIGASTDFKRWFENERRDDVFVGR